MNQKIYKTIVFSLAVILAVNFIFAFSLPVLAQNDSDVLWGNSSLKQQFSTNSGLPNSGNTDFREVITEIIKFVLGFLGILAVIIVLYAGFKWMTSGGNEEKISDSKKMLIAGLIGLIIIVLAYVIANFVIESVYEVINQ